MLKTIGQKCNVHNYHQGATQVEAHGEKNVPKIPRSVTSVNGFIDFMGLTTSFMLYYIKWMTLHSWLAHEKRSLAPLWSSCTGATVVLAHRAPMTVFCGSTHSVFAHRKPTDGPQQAKLLFIQCRPAQARSKRYQRISNFQYIQVSLFV